VPASVILSFVPFQILKWRRQHSLEVISKRSDVTDAISNASLLGSRYEVGRDVFSSVIRFFESPTLRSRSSDSRRSLLLAGSDSVAFSTCSKASSLGSRSVIIAICTNSDGLHKIIHADWLKKIARVCCAKSARRVIGANTGD